MIIRRAFQLREFSNGRLEAKYLVYNANSDLESTEDIPTATLPNRMVELFFAPPDELPAEHLSNPTSTEPVDMSVGYPAGDKTGVKDESPKLSGHLPDGFPGKAAFEKAGYNTYHKVRKLMDAGELETVDDVGPETATKVREIFAAE